MTDKLQALLWETLIALALLVGFALGLLVGPSYGHAALGVDIDNDGTINGYVANVHCSGGVGVCTVSGINWTLAASAGSGDITAVGNCLTGACFTGGAGTASNTLTFTKESTGTIKLENSSTANTAGAPLNITGANGAGTGIGGPVSITAGDPGTNARGGGLNLTTSSGTGAGASTRGGDIQISLGAGSSTAVSGNRSGGVFISGNTTTNLRQAVTQFDVLGINSTMVDGGTISLMEYVKFEAPSMNGPAGGGTETITQGSNVSIIGAINGTNTVFTLPALALWVQPGVQTAGATGIQIDETQALLFDGSGTGDGIFTRVNVENPTVSTSIINIPNLAGVTPFYFAVDATKLTDLDGAGLTTSSATLAVGAGTGITVNANDVALTVPVVLANGGTNQTAWTASRCVQVNAGGTALESAAAGCAGTATLQTAYDAGNSIAATDARDIAITLANTATDPNVTISTATGGAGFTTISRADGAGAADPAQLLLIDNLDTDRAQPIGLTLRSAAGAMTTAIDATDAEIVTALAIGANVLTAADGGLVNLSAINASGTGEGLLLPQATSISSATAEGQVSWETDVDELGLGNGSTVTPVGVFIVGGATATSNTADLEMMMFGGAGAVGGVQRLVFPFAATCSNLNASLGAAPGAGTNYVVTVLDNGSASSVTCTIADANTSCADNTNTVTFTAGQTIAVNFDENGSAASTAGSGWSMRCYPD